VRRWWWSHSGSRLRCHSFRCVGGSSTLTARNLPRKPGAKCTPSSAAAAAARRAAHLRPQVVNVQLDLLEGGAAQGLLPQRAHHGAQSVRQQGGADAGPRGLQPAAVRWPAAGSTLFKTGCCGPRQGLVVAPNCLSAQPTAPAQRPPNERCRPASGAGAAHLSRPASMRDTEAST
jgi:hypothetical protein